MYGFICTISGIEIDQDLTIDQSRKLPDKHGCRRGLDIKFNGLEHENEVKWVLSNLPNTSEKLRLKWAQAGMAREECDH